MQWKAHKAIVRKINEQLNDPFPLDDLLEGATDPDEGVRDRYKKKHHFDNSLLSGGQRNNGRDIVKEVQARVEKARKAWLRGDKNEAAFQFGVATHFFMDGIIISVSVDEQKHDEIEALFTPRAEKLVPPKIQVPELGTRAVVHKTLSKSRNILGSSDLEVLTEAFESLVLVASAVSEVPVPATFVEKTDELSSGFCERFRNALGDFKRDIETVTKQSSKRLDKWSAHKVRESRFYMESLAICEVYERRDTPLLSLAALFGQWRFKRGLEREGLRKPRQFRKDLRDLCKSRKSEARSRLAREHKQWSGGGWFNTEEVRDEALHQVVSVERDVKAEAEKCYSEAKGVVQDLAETTLRNTRVRTCSTLKNWWGDTLRSRIGRLGVGEMCLSLLPVLFAFLAFVYCATSGAWRATVLSLCITLLVSSSWVVWLLLIKHYKVINYFVENDLRKMVRFACPRCGHKAKVWVGLLGCKIQCPSCRKRLKFSRK